MKPESIAIEVRGGYWWDHEAYHNHRLWGPVTPIWDPDIIWIVNGAFIHTEG